MIRKKRMNNSGSTMAEVLIGFVLLMVILASLQHIVQVSSNLTFQSVDLRGEQQAFQSEYYQKDYGVLYETNTHATFVLVETNQAGEVQDHTKRLTLEADLYAVSDDDVIQDSNTVVYQLRHR